MGIGKRTTHFNGSHSEHVPLVGSDLINPNLMPQVLDSVQQAKQLALKNYLTAEEAKSLDMLRTVTRGITRLDNHIADLIHESDSMKEQKKTLEFQMEQLGISVEKIKEAGLLADRPYVRTLEREAQDAEKRRRQLEEEEQQKERQKRQKIVEISSEGEVVGGNVVEVEGDVGDADDAMIVEEQEEQQQTQTQAQPQTQPLPDPNQILFEAKALLERQEKCEQL